MTRPTLRELAGLPSAPAVLKDSTLVLIDCQNTYTQGVMELEGVQAALDEAAALDGAGRVQLGLRADGSCCRDGDPCVAGCRR